MARTPDVLVFSKKAYTLDKSFAQNVLNTLKNANNLTHHKELLQKYYPNYTIIELYTYEHSGMCIERHKRCQFDSSLDGMAAFKNEEKLNKKLALINKYL